MPLPLAVIQESPATRIAPLRILADLSKEEREQHMLVHEIYASVQGESTYAGLPCVFVRTTTCHLRCQYCDTMHAFYDGKVMDLPTIKKSIAAYGISLVELTGGEPLLQQGSIQLMRELCDEGYTVLVETSGGVSTEKVDPRVRIILDVKTPGSGESARNVWENLNRLRPHDEVKFVMCSDEDIDFAKRIIDEYQLAGRAALLFSPSFGQIDPAHMANRIVAEKIPVRLQIQMHKVLWGDKTGV